MANWFGGGGGGFSGMGGLGDRLLGGRGLPAGNPYTGGTGGAYGRAGGGSAFGGYGGGEGSLSADNRALAAMRRPQPFGGGAAPVVRPQPFGNGQAPGAGTGLPIQPFGNGGPVDSTQPIGPRPMPFGGGQVPGPNARLMPMQPFGGGGGSTGLLRLSRGRPY